MTINDQIRETSAGCSSAIPGPRARAHPRWRIRDLPGTPRVPCHAIRRYNSRPRLIATRYPRRTTGRACVKPRIAKYPRVAASCSNIHGNYHGGGVRLVPSSFVCHRDLAPIVSTSRSFADEVDIRVRGLRFTCLFSDEYREGVRWSLSLSTLARSFDFFAGRRSEGEFGNFLLTLR